MHWVESAYFVYFSIKQKMGIEKPESWSDNRLENGTAEMERVRGTGESGICVNEDSVEMPYHLWNHPFCFAVCNPLLSLSFPKSTDILDSLHRSKILFPDPEFWSQATGTSVPALQLITSCVILGKLLCFSDPQLYDKSMWRLQK